MSWAALIGVGVVCVTLVVWWSLSLAKKQLEENTKIEIAQLEEDTKLEVAQLRVEEPVVMQGGAGGGGGEGELVIVERGDPDPKALKYAASLDQHAWMIRTEGRANMLGNNPSPELAEAKFDKARVIEQVAERLRAGEMSAEQADELLVEELPRLKEES